MRSTLFFTPLYININFLIDIKRLIAYNDIIIKYDFFQTNNYERFIELYERMKVPKGVISNIENEYMLQKKIIKQNEKEDKIKYEKENVTSI